jgi:hypothetical protein
MHSQSTAADSSVSSGPDPVRLLMLGFELGAALGKVAFSLRDELAMRRMRRQLDSLPTARG